MVPHGRDPTFHRGAEEAATQTKTGTTSEIRGSEQGPTEWEKMVDGSNGKPLQVAHQRDDATRLNAALQSKQTAPTAAAEKQREQKERSANWSPPKQAKSGEEAAGRGERLITDRCKEEGLAANKPAIRTIERRINNQATARAKPQRHAH